MRVFATYDKEARWGFHKIFFEHQSPPVYIDSAQAMYFSGHGYHSQNDTVFSFKVSLFRGEALYISIEKTEKGYSNGTSIHYFKSTDEGINWDSVPNIPDTNSLKELSTVRK